MPIKIDQSHSSVAQDSRIRSVVLHYTALNNQQSLDVLAKRGQVSAHYLVPNCDNPQGDYPIYELVKPAQRAWHAGVSQWQGINNINFSSIGIEIVNLGFTTEREQQKITNKGLVWDAHGLGWYPYSEAQMTAVVELLAPMVTQYQIHPTRVIGHSDIAPGRKQDPGPLFPWLALAERGIGAWPRAAVVEYYKNKLKEAPLTVKQQQEALGIYGYTVSKSGVLDKSTGNAVAAFQMHFAPTDYLGKADDHTNATLCALVEEYHPSKMSGLTDNRLPHSGIQGAAINTDTNKFVQSMVAGGLVDAGAACGEPYRLSTIGGADLSSAGSTYGGTTYASHHS